MMLEPVNPPGLGTPRGYSNGVLAPAGGRLLFVAGQVGWNSQQQFQSRRFEEQFEQALRNVLSVVAAAGGGPDDIARLRIYVLDKAEYLGCLKEVGRRYRNLMGKHYPAMALVEVRALVEDDARIEIEATAVLADLQAGPRP